jgi:hypothetical protein
VIEFFVIFGGLAGCVEPTMRWLVGWVGWAAQGCKPTNLRTVDSTERRRKGAAIISAGSCDLWPNIEKQMSEKGRRGGILTSKNTLGARLQDVRNKETIQKKQNWLL